MPREEEEEIWNARRWEEKAPKFEWEADRRQSVGRDFSNSLMTERKEEQKKLERQKIKKNCV